MAALLWSTAASAIQFTPPATARLHEFGGLGDGAEISTEGPSAGGERDFDSGTGLLTITGTVDILNHYDPANVLCDTEGTTNCEINYAPDLDFTFTAAYDSSTPGEAWVDPQTATAWVVRYADPVGPLRPRL